MALSRNVVSVAVVVGSLVVGCGGGSTAVDGGSPGTDGGPASMGGAGISATVNGEALAVPGVLATVRSSGGEALTALTGMARVGEAQVYFQIDFPGDAPGSFACTAGEQHPRIQFQRLDGSRNLTADTILGGTCQIDVTEVGAPGGTIRGTFRSHTENGSGVVDIVDGTFALTRQS